MRSDSHVIAPRHRATSLLHVIIARHHCMSSLQVLSDARHEVKVLMNELNQLRRCNEALCHRASMCTQRGDALALSRLKNPNALAQLQTKGKQPFEYVVVVDFEATCMENDKEFRNAILTPTFVP